MCRDVFAAKDICNGDFLGFLQRSGRSERGQSANILEKYSEGGLLISTNESVGKARMAQLFGQFPDLAIFEKSGDTPSMGMWDEV